MKKTLLTVVATTALLLAACGDDNSTKNKNTATATQDATEPSATFENGVLETASFKLTIKDSEIIESPAEGKKGLFITFDLENIGEGEIIPSDTFTWLAATQENDTSNVELTDDYHYLDAFGDDRYNEMVEISNANGNALLPGKTAEFKNAIYLDNEDNPVALTATDETSEVIGTYEIKLK